VSATGGRETLALVEQQDFVAVVIDVATLATDERELPQRLFELRPDLALVVLGSDSRLLAIAGAIMSPGVTVVEVPPDKDCFRSLVVRLLSPRQLQLDGQSRYATSLERARECIERGHHEAAVVHLRNTIALNPERPESYHLLGVLRERYGEFELARKCYHIALVLDPTFEPAALNLERLCILPHRMHPVLDR